MNKNLKTNKEGQLNNILGLLVTGGIMLTIIVITLAIGAEITADIQAQGNTQDENGTLNSSLVYNVSQFGLTGLGNVSGQLGLIGTVIALSVVLLILMALLFRQFAGGKF